MHIYIGKVVCPRYGHDKVESWWLVIGDRNSNSILSIKRVTVGKEAKVRLQYIHICILCVYNIHNVLLVPVNFSRLFVLYIY